MSDNYEWEFKLKDFVDMENEKHIVVYSPTYKKAIRKIKLLELPGLSNYEDTQEGVILINVFELIQDEEDSEQENIATA